jgi:ABC-type antimicrobial peptide transport system permease subunit
VNWPQSLIHAASNLARRPLRNLLAGGGVVLAIALLVSLLAIARGVQFAALERAREQPLLNLVQVLPGAASAGIAARPIDDAALTQVRGLSGVRAATAVQVVPTTLKLEGRTAGGTVLGITPTDGPLFGLQAGRTPLSDEAAVALLTPGGVRALATTVDLALATTLELELRRGANRSERRTVLLRVVGVTSDELPGQLAVIPFADADDALMWIVTGESEDARALRLAQQAISALLLGGGTVTPAQLGSRYTSIWAFATSPAELRQVVRGVEGLGFSGFSPVAISQTLDNVLRALNAALAAIAAIALIVAFLGIVNALVTSVSERTAEIGLLKALGARDSVVEQLFLFEAGLLGAVGGVIGAGLGAALAVAAAGLARQVVPGTTLEARLDPLLIGGAVLVATVIAIAAGWLPARRAARLVPAEALRTE